MERTARRDRTEAILARLLLASLEHSPRGIADSLGRIYAGLLDLAIPRLRRTAETNLQFAFPDRNAAWRKKTIDGIYASIGRLLVAFARFPSISQSNVHQWIRYEGFEHYERAKARGRGVLFATAHLGNWELSAFAHALMTEPMSVVVRALDNQRIDRLVEARRMISGNRIIEKHDAARAILRSLKNNEAVGILIDQNSSLSEGVFVDFFGVPACAGTAFVKLAAHSGATVIPGFALWSDKHQRYTLRFYPPLEITGRIEADTQRLQSLLETVIREYPDQWLWIHRRWKTRPAGEPPLYRA